VPKFTATIGKLGVNPYVTVHASVSTAFSRRGNIPVKGTLNDFPITATLTPTGNGRHRLYINTEMSRGAKVAEGDIVTFALELDTGSRESPVPEVLVRALESNEAAKTVWENMPPSHRREYLAYLKSLKKPETLERNVHKVIAALLKKTNA
jgi:hypothetical protein